MANSLSAPQVEHQAHGRRVVFVTTQIAPKTLPPFPYMPTGLTVEAVEFTAVITAGSQDTACAEIRDHWPDARFVSIEFGEWNDDFLARSLPLHPMGSIPFHAPPPPKKRSRWASIKHVLFGTTPF